MTDPIHVMMTCPNRYQFPIARIVLVALCVTAFQDPMASGQIQAPASLRPHIRTFINGGSSDRFLAERFDLFGWGNLNAKLRNPNAINLLYAYFGTNVPGATNKKHQALLAYAATNGLSEGDIEDMYLHAQSDVSYRLGAPAELDPRETRTVPGWDPINDTNGDGVVDDDEFAVRSNIDASARTKSDARIPIYYWGPPADYLMNVGDPDYVQFILSHANDLILDNQAYEGLAYWNTPELIQLTTEPYVGSLSCLVDVSLEDQNLLFRQYVSLEPNTTYTMGAALKTAGLSGFVRVYQWEFGDAINLGNTIQVGDPTSDWSVHVTQFETGMDVDGRFTVRVFGGPGQVWFDGLHLAQGSFTDYASLTVTPNLLENGGCEQVQTARYDGLELDTLRDSPVVQGDTQILEYPQFETYGNDIRSLLSSLVGSLPAGTVIVGNGWQSDPFIIHGTLRENFARMTAQIHAAKLDTVLERDAAGDVQLIQYNPIYDEVANPNRPDLFVEGVTLEQDQLYGLALYYLVHGDNTYFGYGVHGNYPLDRERWFDAVEYDVGQPLGPYEFLVAPNPTFTGETVSLLVNGDFETDANGDGNPDSWQIAEPVQLDGAVKYEGAFSARIESGAIINNINKQYVTLEPNTAYTLSGWIKTEDVTGEGAQIYPYEFDDCSECLSTQAWIRVNGTEDWAFYYSVFLTGTDADGRINFRISAGTGTAWFDDIRLTEGVHTTTLLGRSFENAIVLLNPYSGGVDALIRYDLDGAHFPLRADGSFGGSTRTAFVHSGQGAIFAKAPTGLVPAMSEWGVVAMILLLTAAGTVVLRRRAF